MVSNSTVSLTNACVVSHAQFKMSVSLEIRQWRISAGSGEILLWEMEVKMLWAEERESSLLRGSLKSRCIANCFMTRDF